MNILTDATTVMKQLPGWWTTLELQNSGESLKAKRLYGEVPAIPEFSLPA